MADDRQNMIDIAFTEVRANADESGYGSYFSDEACRTLATRVVDAILKNYNAGDGPGA